MNIQPKPETLVPQSVTTGSLPGSRKIYHRAEGRDDILVPFREIALDPSANEPPVRVYDASGPYSEEGAHIDLAAGLPRIRAPWLAKRYNHTYGGRAVKPEDNGSVSPERLVPPCPAATSPRVGDPEKIVTQYEYARAGIITEEMIFVAHRENLAARRWSKAPRRVLPMANISAHRSRPSSRRNSCAMKSPAAAPSSPPISITPSLSR